MSVSDKIECIELIQKWGFWRDQGCWSELLTTFNDDGLLSVSWFRGRLADYVEESKRAAAAARSQSKHLIGYPILSIIGHRAIAETNVVILGRQEIDGIPVDNTAYARFLDRLEKRDGHWRVSERAAIYEKDTMAAVTPDPAFDALMNSTDFSAYPAACRFLAFRLVRMGRSLASPIYCDGTKEALELRETFSAWLRDGTSE
jgi:hypothetical protein